MKGLITIDQLNKEQVLEIFSRAQENLTRLRNSNQSSIKNNNHSKTKTLINLFFENSTRTRTSFEISAHLLDFKIINFDVNNSSIKKGESIIDTAKTINAMNPDFIVTRHESSGFAELFSKNIDCHLINAGDGTNEHPTQALTDAFTILQHKKTLTGIKIAICGDILHSRVAHSNIKLLKKFGANISLATPATLISNQYEKWLIDRFQIKIFKNIESAIQDADVVMMLRIQQERMSGCYIPSLGEYFNNFGINHKKIILAKKDVIIMHPGPINREVEISSQIADDKKYSVILEQVESGIAVRKALLEFLMNSSNK